MTLVKPSLETGLVDTGERFDSGTGVTITASECDLVQGITEDLGDGFFGYHLVPSQLPQLLSSRYVTASLSQRIILTHSAWLRDRVTRCS